MANTSPHKWKDEYWFKIYDLARSGMTDCAIATAMGWSHRSTLFRFYRKKPALKEAVERVRAEGGKSETFRDYVHGRLPAKLKKLWDKILSWEEDPYGVDKVEAMLARRGQRVRQHLFFYALVHGNFNITEACRLVNISTTTFRQWLNLDPDFQALMEEIHWHKKNFFEGALINLVKNGDSAATIFVNRTVNRDRGYNDKHTTDVNVSISGEVNHKHAQVTLKDLDLSLEARKEILQKLRQKTAPAQLTHEQAGEVIDAEFE